MIYLCRQRNHGPFTEQGKTMSVELSGKGQERRTALREPIRRRVVFAGVRGEGLLRQGMAVDISASGLLIHTTQPDLGTSS